MCLHVYNKNSLKVCLTIYNVIFAWSIFASEGIFLCFNEKIGNLKSAERIILSGKTY